MIIIIAYAIVKRPFGEKTHCFRKSGKIPRIVQIIGNNAVEQSLSLKVDLKEI